MSPLSFSRLPEEALMNENSPTQRYLKPALWIFSLSFAVVTYFKWILPHADGITLNGEIMLGTLKEVGGFLLGIMVGIGLLELFVFQIFFRKPKNLTTAIIIRVIQGLIGFVILLLITSFFATTGLISAGEGVFASIIEAPGSLMTGLTEGINGFLGEEWAGIVTTIVVAAILLIFFGIIQALSLGKKSKVGLAYLLILPAFIGVLFLIIYPFIFEIRLAFSNASLGTQATKNAQYGLIHGWENLKTLFTGSVAKNAKFFEVFVRTILWTVINVFFHVGGGMFLAILLNRPMKLQGLYRTLLVFPWAIPTTVAAMALRNEFDSRYGLFNILLTNLQNWLTAISAKVNTLILLGPTFNWLATHIGPVSWKQDPFWAFISILISNIWLGIPFMAVIILGGLQSISQEYYEAAEIDGAGKWQQFRNITMPLIQPVLTPAIILGVVWTFNKFDIIYLITQGGPQEKTDILVSSMYKAAFQFYRYGFTAMFALVIFVILFLFTLVYLRVTGGTRSIYD